MFDNPKSIPLFIWLSLCALGCLSFAIFWFYHVFKKGIIKSRSIYKPLLYSKGQVRSRTLLFLDGVGGLVASIVSFYLLLRMMGLIPRIEVLLGWSG